MNNEIKKLLKDNLLKIPSMDFTFRTMQKIHEMQEGQVKKKINRWFILSPLAAAAVLALFLIFFSPWSSRNTISWADVQKKLEQINTMTYRYCVETPTGEGVHIIHCGKISHKDPGFSRMEEYAQDTNLDTVNPEIESILIVRREPGLTEQLTLHPVSHHAERVTRIIRNIGSKLPSQIIGLASENWKMMKQITADKTKRIGERIINGKPAVGFEFEAPAREMWMDPTYEPIGQGHVQIWAGRDDGVPLAGELDFQTASGQRIRVEGLVEWNIKLDESLFDLSVPEGWSISRTRIETAKYSGVGLAPGVTLGISAEGQEKLASAEDVSEVVSALQTTHLDSNITEVHITLALKPDAARRLHEYADTQPNQLIVVDFNGQINVRGRLDAASPTQLNLDLSLLGLSLAELEKKYFTTSIEMNKP